MLGQFDVINDDFEFEDDVTTEVPFEAKLPEPIKSLSYEVQPKIVKNIDNYEAQEVETGSLMPGLTMCPVSLS